jgi:hypothetical protein
MTLNTKNFIIIGGMEYKSRVEPKKAGDRRWHFRLALTTEFKIAIKFKTFTITILYLKIGRSSKLVSLTKQPPPKQWQIKRNIVNWLWLAMVRWGKRMCIFFCYFSLFWLERNRNARSWSQHLLFNSHTHDSYRCLLIAYTTGVLFNRNLIFFQKIENQMEHFLFSF